MLKDITIGQYFPGDTLVHKLDPRVKIFTAILYIIALFFVKDFYPYIFIILFIATVVRTAKLPIKFIVKGLKPLMFIIIITFTINLLFTRGEVIFSLGPISVTKEGIIQSVFMALRLILLIVGTSLLTLTTSPIALTDGIESLLSPFRKIGLPSHELAMMMTIALRFIPTLLEETDKIMKAQMARGADFESGNILNRAKSLVPLLVPLFINAFRRADELATAMEARCYRGGEGRTRLNELKFDKKDSAILLSLIVFFGFIMSTRYWWRKMKNIMLTLEYDGTNYSGWQIQDNANSIQAEVEKAIYKLTKKEVTLIGAGRTDAKVHALGQVANFFIDTTIPGRTFKYALNEYLPEDIKAVYSNEVPEDFHARFSAIKKRYRYKIYLSDVERPLLRNYAYQIDRNLNINNMKEASKYLIGTHNFTSFEGRRSFTKSKIRTIRSIDIKKRDEFIDIVVEGDSFLRNMVRIITGTLVEIGIGKRKPEEIKLILQAEDRRLSGHTAPPQGLYLEKVFYKIFM